MSDLACPLNGESHRQVKLDDVLAAFAREARPGVLDTGHYRCPYYEWGKGPPLVLVPGLADDSLSFVLVAALLSRTFRCITYDHPVGRGDGCNLWRRTHRDFVDDLFALLDHWDVGEGYLYGSSFGSTITLAALYRQPERFPRAILQGGFARRPLSACELTLARMCQHWWRPLSEVPLRRLVALSAHAPPFSCRDPALWRFFLERSGEPPSAAVATRALIVNQLDLRSLLPRIPMPVLLICGDHDPLVRKVCEEELLKGVPRPIRAEIQGCGHEPVFTHPEVVVELVERFIGRERPLVPPGRVTHSSRTVDGRFTSGALSPALPSFG